MRRGSRSGFTPRLAGLLVLLGAAVGCTNYHYVVRTTGAPLYADPARSEVIVRMERLDDGYIGHSAPEGDPVAIEYRGVAGYASRKDLRLFSCPNRAYEERVAIFVNRREVVLEGTDWPDEMKQAIGDDRVMRGMTREMVRLAWGAPTATRSVDGGEVWIYDRVLIDVYEDVHYHWVPGLHHVYYTYPYGWGLAYHFPRFEPTYYRTYYERTYRRTVTFSAVGTVVSWNEAVH